MESIFGGLIAFESKEEFEKQLEIMDKSLSLKLLDLSIRYSVRNGAFSLEESYCLYKCISKLKETSHE